MSEKEISELSLRRSYIQTFEGSESGDLVLKDLQNRCFKRDTTMSHNALDATGIFFNEGMRSVLIHIESMMSPEGIANCLENEQKGSE